MKTGLLALAAAAATASAEPALHYAVGERQIAVMDQATRSLHTFAPDARAAALADALGCSLPNVGLAQLLAGTDVPCGDRVIRSAVSAARDMPRIPLEELSREYDENMERTDEREYPYDLLDFTGKTVHSDLMWVYNFLRWHWSGDEVHPFVQYAEGESGIYNAATGEMLPAGLSPAERIAAIGETGDLTVALAADWGSGTYEAATLGTLIAGLEPEHTIHVGDIYYVGSEPQVQSNCLGQAPKGAQHGVQWPLGSVGSWATNGNHESYARFEGFYDAFMPALGPSGSADGQKASYFALETEDWRIITLDTGYNCFSQWAFWDAFESSNNTQPEPVIDWLVNEVQIADEDDPRGIILLSHHQYRSAFGAPLVATPEQIAPLLPDRDIMWLWGHEHRLGIYDLGTNEDIPIRAYGRCVGNGGFPDDVSAIPADARSAGLLAFDSRLYEAETGFHNVTVDIGYNGFQTLAFAADGSVTAEYRTFQLDASGDGSLDQTESTLMASEVWHVNSTTGDVYVDGQVFGDDMTVISNN